MDVLLDLWHSRRKTTMNVHAMLKRLKDDFQLSMITLMGLMACCGIGPYVIYRALEGSWLVAFVDMVMVISSMSCVTYAWLTGKTHIASIIVTLIVSIGAVMVALEIGINGLFWIYALVLVNFLMTGPWLSLVIMSSVLVSVCTIGMWRGDVFASHYQMTSFIVTCMLCCLFSFMFALRTRYQHAMLKHMTTLDPLTGASNRRALAQELEVALARFARTGEMYGLLAIDLDHFKSVNDTYGHAAGDKVLVDFVRILKSRLRSSDRIFRLGGEEFLVLLADVDEASLKATAKQIHTYLGEHLKGPGGAITVSIGGALIEPNETADQWLNRADKLLYQAKHSGRNCSLFASKKPLVAALI